MRETGGSGTGAVGKSGERCTRVRITSEIRALIRSSCGIDGVQVGSISISSGSGSGWALRRRRSSRPSFSLTGAAIGSGAARRGSGRRDCGMARAGLARKGSGANDPVTGGIIRRGAVSVVLAARLRARSCRAIAPPTALRAPLPNPLASAL